MRRPWPPLLPRGRLEAADVHQALPRLRFSHRTGAGTVQAFRRRRPRLHRSAEPGANAPGCSTGEAGRDAARGRPANAPSLKTCLSSNPCIGRLARRRGAALTRQISRRSRRRRKRPCSQKRGGPEYRPTQLMLGRVCPPANAMREMLCDMSRPQSNNQNLVRSDSNFMCQSACIHDSR